VAQQHAAVFREGLMTLGLAHCVYGHCIAERQGLFMLGSQEKFHRAIRFGSYLETWRHCCLDPRMTGSTWE
jgi:hypothetical protein